MASFPQVFGTTASTAVTPNEYYATLAAQGQTLTLSGLNGDSDGLYRVEFEALLNQAAVTFKIQVNGADTNLANFTANAGVGGVASANWQISQAAQTPAQFSAGDFYRFQGQFRVKSGRVKTMTGLAYVLKGGTATGWQFYGTYADTATNVTSMSLVASAANGFASGTYIYVVQVPVTNPLA